MPEPTSLPEKYGSDLAKLQRNNLYVHGTQKKNLFPGSDQGGILEAGLKNGTAVSKETLARSVLLSAAVRYGGSGIDGVLVFYRPPKGTLVGDERPFPPTQTRITHDALGEETATLNAEQVAFWLETGKSGIDRYVVEAVAQILENLTASVDLIGAHVDELAHLIAEHALVPNSERSESFTEANVDETHHALDLDTATMHACEILWNAMTESLFHDVESLRFYTDHLLGKIKDPQDNEDILRILSGREVDVNALTSTTSYVVNFSLVWKQLKDIKLPYENLQAELEARMSRFYADAQTVEVWIDGLLKTADEQRKQREELHKSKRYRMRQFIKSALGGR